MVLRAFAITMRDDKLTSCDGIRADHRSRVMSAWLEQLGKVAKLRHAGSRIL